jgi:uncharacterized repeat protein (TIGR03803 family)
VDAANGTVFEIVKTAGGNASTPTNLLNFNGTDGFQPAAGLIADASGNPFGTTAGAGVYWDGTVFEIAKTAGGYASAPITLVSFNGTNGASPEAGLIADSSGNLFGTTMLGGAYNDGTVFEIVKTASGYASTPTTLVSFNGTDGGSPFAGLIADRSGNLFGTTMEGGAYNDGAVFEVTDSGFLPPPLFAGTPGRPNCHGRSVGALARQYGGLNNAAAALGYPSVRALQKAILEFCEPDEAAEHRKREHHQSEQLD